MQALKFDLEISFDVSEMAKLFLSFRFSLEFLEQV